MKVLHRVAILMMTSLLVSSPLYASRDEGYRLLVGMHYADSYETRYLPEFSEAEWGLAFGAMHEWKWLSACSLESGLMHFSRVVAVSSGSDPDMVSAPYIEWPVSLRLRGKNLSLGAGASAAYGYGRFRKVSKTHDGHGTGYTDYDEAGISRFESSFVIDVRLVGDFAFQDLILTTRYRRNLSSPSTGDNSMLHMSYTPLFTDIEFLVGKAL